MTVSSHSGNRSTAQEPRVVLGLWPIAGVTTVGVTHRDAIQTIEAAIEEGVHWFDTAFSYGYDGESDHLLAEVLRHAEGTMKVIGKVGQRWDENHKRIVDGRPKTLIADAEVSLQRLGIDEFECLMLHSIDVEVPLQDSVEALMHLQGRGLCRTVGVCNVNVDELAAFHAITRCRAIQCPLNLLQRDSLQTLIPFCRDNDIQVYTYWTLMKGLLAGKITRDYRFPPGDSRPGYEIFQGEKRQRAHDVVDQLAVIAREEALTVPQLSIGWALSQPGITGALVGARREQQAREIARARRLEPSVLQRVEAAVQQRS